MAALARTVARRDARRPRSCRLRHAPGAVASTNAGGAQQDIEGPPLSTLAGSAANPPRRPWRNTWRASSGQVRACGTVCATRCSANSRLVCLTTPQWTHREGPSELPVLLQDRRLQVRHAATLAGPLRARRSPVGAARRRRWGTTLWGEGAHRALALRAGRLLPVL